MNSKKGPLSGFKVVDITTSYAGPAATMYMGDMGADVIKIERPGSGDDARSWGPPFVGPTSAWFLSVNRNKRSICVDLGTDAGFDVLHRLLAGADVFVENLNPAKLAQKGLDPETLTARYPGLVYCALSGFGLDGPDRSAPGYDLVAQARSGLMSVTGAKGGTPQRVSTALSDNVAGMLAAFAVSAALVQKVRTGRGEVIDVSLLEADLALMAPRIAAYLAGEPEPRPSGGTDSVLAVYQAFDTADEAVVLAVGNDEMWRRCCGALGLEELADDPRFATNAGRRANRAELIEMIATKMRTATAEEWLARFAKVKVPCQPVYSLSQVVSDRQVKSREAIGEYETSEGEAYRAVRAPWRLDSIDRGPDRPPPRYGAHTLEVLEEFGFAENEVQQLAVEGVIWDNGTKVR